MSWNFYRNFLNVLFQNLMCMEHFENLHFKNNLKKIISRRLIELKFCMVSILMSRARLQVARYLATGWTTRVSTWMSEGLEIFLRSFVFRLVLGHGRLARWHKWRACDVGEAKKGLENELWCRWSNRRVVEWACDVGKVTEGLDIELRRRWCDRKVGEWAEPTFPSVHLCHSSFSNPSVTSPTSQLILQSFCHFTDITVHSPTLPPQALHLHHLASCPCKESRLASVVMSNLCRWITWCQFSWLLTVSLQLFFYARPAMHIPITLALLQIYIYRFH